MPVDHKEKAFESAIEYHLLTTAGYTKAEQGHFDQERALDTTQFIPFIQDTQPDTWKKLDKLLGVRAEEILLDDLCKAMDSPRQPGRDPARLQVLRRTGQGRLLCPGPWDEPGSDGALREEPADGRPPAFVQAHQH